MLNLMMRIITILFLFSLNWIYSQEEKEIRIVFDAKISQVENLGERMKIARVRLYEDNIPKDSVITKHGRYFYDLKKDHKYKVEFSKTGYVSKFLIIDTFDLPEDYKKKSSIKVDVGLFTEKKDLDVAFLKERPIGIAAYDDIEKKIEWNRDYTKMVIEELIKATLSYSDKKKKGNRKNL